MAFRKKQIVAIPGLVRHRRRSLSHAAAHSHRGVDISIP
jgi:hypothetical protein